jgi:hypothetical protein
MPRFFFDVHDDIDMIDDDGVELPDADAAAREALRGARALICEQVTKGRINLSHFVKVRDEAGAHVATVSFDEAVTLER